MRRYQIPRQQVKTLIPAPLYDAVCEELKQQDEKTGEWKVPYGAISELNILLFKKWLNARQRARAEQSKLVDALDEMLPTQE